MAEIVLSTLNARYQHTAFSLRYLYANLEELHPRARIIEFTTQQNPRDIAERILAENPRIVGFSVYIWNTAATREVVAVLKKIRPEIVLVLGGPEVSHESEKQAICQLADYTIQGEGDFLFRDFCRNLLEKGEKPRNRFISGPLPEIKQIRLPYQHYTAEDIRNRVIYVEASRGCPYKCEYCLSSLDKQVRSFELSAFLGALDELIGRGARQFKFLDRTFNLSITTCKAILEFFLERMHLGLFVHFEMVPDRLPEELRALLKKFPPGAVQFEIGVQTWNPEVSKLVSRRQDYAKIRENFRFLIEETGVHLHADLIAALPGETLESFASGFDALFELRPHEIQLGILKKLRGTPIARHDQEWQMLYQDEAPYLVLQTRTMDYATIQRLIRIAKFWDLVGNSGNFKKTMLLFQALSKKREDGSFFRYFMELADFLSARHPQGHGIALLNLVESLWLYLSGPGGADPDRSREALIEDYTVTIKRDVPAFLRTDRKESQGLTRNPANVVPAAHTPSRQRRHIPPEEKTQCAEA